ncbi:hypothetical protein UCREL1_355 [Eutypa lata UCREL1]|uniref:Uncharacterized protein n=1 Tax=Eutypa lata (strain UCR-EL1) TaxID=1287681 RepID=M7T6T9_EUTLA|nr:hypothetical protein UCREL1_355 [Eutypa lata UCREL1]
MADSSFIQLNGPNRNPGPGGPPPPPGHSNPRAGPQQFPTHQQQHMAMPRGPPMFPRDQLPPDLRLGRTVEVTDVSEEFLSDTDMRNKLAEFAVYRFEKMPQQSPYNEDGELQLPTWDKAVRTQVTGMSQRQIATEIRHLDQRSNSVLEKKSALSTTLQRQIDKARDNLVAHEGPQDPIYYQWVLAQLDHQLREIPRSLANRGKIYSSHRSKSNSAKKRAVYASYGHKKKQYERISLTAYFRREPRPNVNIKALWDIKRLQTMNGNHQPWPPVLNQMPHPGGPPGPDNTEEDVEGHHEEARLFKIKIGDQHHNRAVRLIQVQVVDLGVIHDIRQLFLAEPP